MHTNKALWTAWRFQQAVNSSFSFHPQGETGHQHQSSSSHQCMRLYKTTLCLFLMEEHWMCFTASFHDTLCFCRQSVTTWDVSSTVFSCTFTKRNFTASGQTNLLQTKKPNQTNPLRHYGTLKQGIKNTRSQLITFFRSNYFPFFIQTHQEQIYTWTGVQNYDKRGSLSLKNTVCLGANVATFAINHCQCGSDDYSYTRRVNKLISTVCTM